MNHAQLEKKWYVLHTRSRFENVVNDGLLKKSFKVFLPKVQVKSRRRDRKLMIRVPVFPGYLFVQSDLDPREHIEIVKTIGAVRIVGTKDGPVPVPSQTIESLQILVATDAQIKTGHKLAKGDKVMVVRGIFAGIVGMFTRYRGTGRVIINVDTLGQTAGVEVDEEDIEPVPKLFA
ncbi:MAG: UpxY family transcription antiterminator [Deltaproteobacteria bacterium]|nr:UpxY family transcription antiterminator [Deltaproteobacteria bacterium]MBW2675954.1 UpxY family transcription antiterminator [Deltaproteobacteria bacterium]